MSLVIAGFYPPVGTGKPDGRGEDTYPNGRGSAPACPMDFARFAPYNRELEKSRNAVGLRQEQPGRQLWNGEFLVVT